MKVELKAASSSRLKNTTLACVSSMLLATAAWSEPILLFDRVGTKVSVDESFPCTSPELPLIVDSQVAPKLNDDREFFGPLWSARLEIDNAQLCRFRPGDWVNFERRVRGVPVYRGRAEVLDDMGWTGRLEVEAISSVLPPETGLSSFLATRDPKAPFPFEQLKELYDVSDDPAEKRELAFLIGSMAVSTGNQSQLDQSVMVDYLERAAEAGHPVAMFNLVQLSGLQEYIWEATANVSSSAEALEKLSDLLPTQAGTYLFQSAEANYAQALRTLKRAETFGLDISQNGVKLAELPTLYNVDAAVNAHLQETSYGNMLPAGVAIQRCDGTWCHIIGGSKFRITVDGVACKALGSGSVSCDVTARFILTNDFGNDAANWQASFMSLTTNAAPFGFSTELIEDRGRWKVVRMQGY